jgi:hypothetical protein
MRRSRWMIVLALGAALSPELARAGVTQDSFLLRNTGDLVSLCTAPQSQALFTAAVNFCQGFVVGIFRVLNEEDAARESGKWFCLPEPAPTRNEGIASFVEWAKANPSKMDQQPADSVALFLSQQYPCPRGIPSKGASK